jgi:hypothetical protein
VSTRGGTIQHKFKIGQALLYFGRGRNRSTSGPFVVLAVLPQMQGNIRYRIRSQNDWSLEHIASEDELKPIRRNRRRAGNQSRYKSVHELKTQ